MGTDFSVKPKPILKRNGLFVFCDLHLTSYALHLMVKEKN
jgi:hypothetical protein